MIAAIKFGTVGMLAAALGESLAGTLQGIILIGASCAAAGYMFAKVLIPAIRLLARVLTTYELLEGLPDRLEKLEQLAAETHKRVEALTSGRPSPTRRHRDAA